MLARLMKPLGSGNDIKHMESNIGRQIAVCTERVGRVCERTDKLDADLKDMRIEMEERKREFSCERAGAAPGPQHRRNSMGAASAGSHGNSQHSDASTSWTPRTGHGSPAAPLRYAAGALSPESDGSHPS